MPPTAVIQGLAKKRLIHRPRNAAQYTINSRHGNTQCVSNLDCSAINTSGQPASATISQYKLPRSELVHEVRKTSASKNPIRKNCTYAKIDRLNRTPCGRSRVCAPKLVNVAATRSDLRSVGLRIANTSVNTGTSK